MIIKLAKTVYYVNDVLFELSVKFITKLIFSMTVFLSIYIRVSEVDVIDSIRIHK